VLGLSKERSPGAFVLRFLQNMTARKSGSFAHAGGLFGWEHPVLGVDAFGPVF
jgi:hypothetical protein